MTREDEILLSEVNGRVAVSRELLAKSGLSQEIINDLDGLFLIIKSFNDIISDLRKEIEELTNAMVTEFREMSKLCKRIEELESLLEQYKRGR